MSLRQYVHTYIPFVSSMQNSVKTVMAINVEIQSRKLVKPSVSTPLALRRYKLSFIDEAAPAMNIPLVLFFPPNRDFNQKSVGQLEESLTNTLTLLYPLAGRYTGDISTIDCNDQGVEFILARADATIKEILGHKIDPYQVSKLTPAKLKASDFTDPLLATQVTTFQDGGLALGVSLAHRIGDVSAIMTFLQRWAALSRKDAKLESNELDFTASLLFPAQGVPVIEVGFPKLFDNEDYVSKKLTFTRSAISNMNTRVGKSSTRRFSKVQLVSALISKAFIGVDHAIYGHPRDSVLLQPIALRQKGEKLASLKLKNSVGNHFGLIITKCGATKMQKEFEDVTNILADSIMKAIRDYSKIGHNERKEMVLDSFYDIADIPETTNVIWIVSWCKLPFYDVDYGFGKPVWVSSGCQPFTRGMVLLDDAEGNGVEAYVSMGVEDVSYFEQDEDIKAFSV